MQRWRALSSSVLMRIATYVTTSDSFKRERELKLKINVEVQTCSDLTIKQDGGVQANTDTDAVR